jgi:hypothetical protein
VTTVICPICDKPLDEEEAENPRREPDEDGRVICDNCFRDKYIEHCKVCENSIEPEDQNRIILPEGDSNGLEPGIYGILQRPYYMTDCLGSFEVIKEHVVKLADIPLSYTEEGGGYICYACLETIRNHVKKGGVTTMKRNIPKEDYIQESFEKIEENLATLDLKPYSKTIIELRLRAVAKKYGVTAANKLIDDLGLEYYGWKKVSWKDPEV